MNNLKDVLLYIYWNICIFIDNLLEYTTKLIRTHSLIVFYILFILKLIKVIDINWLLIFSILIGHILLVTIKEVINIKEHLKEDMEEGED